MKNIYAMIGGVLFICLIGIICISIPTFALDEDNNEKIDILMIESGDSVLEKNSNGEYIVDDMKSLNIIYKFKNLDSDKYYTYEFVNKDSLTNYDFEKFKGNVDWVNQIRSYSSINLNTKSAITDIVVNLYSIPNEDASVTDGTLIYSETIKLNYLDFDKYDLTKRNVYVTEVKQNDIVIEPVLFDYDNSANFKINGDYDFLVKVQGDNLVEDDMYTIFIGASLGFFADLKYTYTGYELNNGVYLNIPNSFGSVVLFLNPYFGEVIKYKNGEDSYSILYDKSSTTSKNYAVKLKYKSSLNELNPNDWSCNNCSYDYNVNPKYHDQDKPLFLDIKSSGYEDKIYNGNIKIYKDLETIYNKNISFNGSELNNGILVELDNFYMELPSAIDAEEAYFIHITLNNKTYVLKCIYVGEQEFSTAVFYEDGKKVFNYASGGGTNHGGAGVYYVNREDSFNDKMYFRTVANNFEDLEEYDYEFYYNENWYDKKFGFELIETGKITGLKLNTIGFVKKIENSKKYETPSYFLVIRKNGKIVYHTGAVMSLRTSPTIASLELYSRNKGLYYQLSDSRYIASNNAKLQIKINGRGFVDDLNYTLYFYMGSSTEHKEKEYTFKGKDLNEGKATFMLEEFANGEKIESIYVSTLGGGTGAVNITYVDIKDLFLEKTHYIVDNILDVIKGISKSTSVSDFVKNVGIVDNGSVKVFDNFGINEVTDKVGTGMLARLVDEYDNNLIDMDIVVKGDVTGDGVISITDLVKVKKHLAKVESIEDIYELGGDITGTGSIGITDLVKMAKDVAKIEEIK